MKITTLIPAYKPKYLFELLTALRHQSVKPHKILFSDDSPDGAFSRQLNAPELKVVLSDLDISVVEGPRRGAHANCKHVVETWGGATELFHMLCDDDIIYPSFYERHLQAHQAGEFSSTVSRRWTASEGGQPLRDPPVPPAVGQHPQRMLVLDAGVLFAQTAALGWNWLGEVSNTVMRAELGEKLRVPELGGISYAGLEDMGTYLHGTLSRPLCFINEHLGYFRLNPGQNTQQLQGREVKRSHLAWFALAIAGRRLGKLQPAQVAECAGNMGQLVLGRYALAEDMAVFCGLIPALAGGEPGAEDRFLDAWAAYLAVP